MTEFVKTIIKKYRDTTEVVADYYERVDDAYTRLLFTNKVGTKNDIIIFWVEYYLLCKHLFMFKREKDTFDERYRHVIERKFQLCKDSLSYIKNNTRYSAYLYNTRLYELWTFEDRLIEMEKEYKVILNKDERMSKESKKEIDFLAIIPALGDYAVTIFYCQYYYSIFNIYKANFIQKFAFKALQALKEHSDKLYVLEKKIFEQCKDYYHLNLEQLIRCQPIDLNLIMPEVNVQYFSIANYFTFFYDQEYREFSNNENANDFTSVSYTAFYFEIESGNTFDALL